MLDRQLRPGVLVAAGDQRAEVAGLAAERPALDHVVVRDEGYVFGVPTMVADLVAQARGAGTGAISGGSRRSSTEVLTICGWRC
jgi:hypothetical protein